MRRSYQKNPPLLNFFLSITLLISFIILFLFTFETPVYAIPTYWDVEVPSDAQIRSVSECTAAGAAYTECVNSHNLGNCGKPDCAQGIDWTKYKLTCVFDAVDGYVAYYNEGEAICSIGDKCIGGEEGLRPGFCDCGTGGSKYKVCCSGTSPVACTLSGIQDNNPPPEGECPGGEPNTRRCGFGGYPACDDPSICGGTPPPPPPGGRTCDYNRSYDQCCAIGLSQNVDEYTWSDGSGVCDNVEGACNQSDPTCGGAAPPPPPPANITIGGRVSDCTNSNPISGAVVSVYNNRTGTTQTGTTDGAGNFAVSGHVVSGDAYAVRPPASAPSGYSNPSSPSSYESQIGGGSPSCGTSCNFCYTPPAAFNYSIFCSDLTVAQGSSGISYISLTKQGSGTAQSVALSATVSPGGPTVSAPSPSSCTPNTSCSSQFTISTSGSTTPGTYIVTVTGQTASLANKTDQCILTVPTTSACSITSVIDSVTGANGTISKNTATGEWHSAEIKWVTRGKGGGNVYYNNGSPCTLATCTSSGWSDVYPPIPDATTDPPPATVWSTPFNPNDPSKFTVTAGSTHTIGVTGGDNVLCNTSNVTFANTTPPPPPPPPGGGGGSCLLGYTGSRWAVTLWSTTTPPSSATLTVGATNVAIPETGPSGWTCDAAAVNCAASTAVRADSPGTSGSYSDTNGNNCSYTIPSAPPPRCSDGDSYTGTVTVSVYEDPNFIATDWPSYTWEANPSGTACYLDSGTSSLTTQPTIAQNTSQSRAVLGEVLQAGTHSCFNNNDCNDLAENSCQNYYCDAWIPFIAGNCQPTGYKPRGATCGVSTNGGNKYCDGATPVCQDNLCLNNTDCNDGNNCTNNSCPTTTDPDYPGPWICSNTNKPVGSECGVTPTGNGKYYCGGATSPDGKCYKPPEETIQYCITAADCNDGNQCTNDVCTGYVSYIPPDPIDGGGRAEKLGTCTINNANPTSVCEQTAAGSSVSLCSAGTAPGITPFIESTCSIPYITCTSLGAPGADGNCCGTTNIQGRACTASGTCVVLNAYTGPTNKPVANADVVISESDCGLSYFGKTGPDGKAIINGVRIGYGKKKTTSGSFILFQWDVKVTPPTGSEKYTFTRALGQALKFRKESGFCFNLGDITLEDWTIPGDPPQLNDMDFNECVEGVNRSWATSMSATFGFKKGPKAFIQTTGGDVHSNEGINVPNE